MQIQQTLNSADWQAVQSDWLALLGLAAAPRENLPWDILLLSLDRHLNLLQRLTLNKCLTSEEQQNISALVHARFDQVLEQLNLQRQQHQPYLLQENLYRGPFSRYRALGDLELCLKEMQHELALPQIPREIRDHVLHDLNLELLERYALQHKPSERPQIWSDALHYTAYLSWNPLAPAEALNLLFQKMPAVNKQPELALRVLKTSRFLHSQCAAVRVLMSQSSDLSQDLMKLLKYAETPNAVILEIVSRLNPGQAEWQEVLLDLLAHAQTNSKQDKTPFFQVRQAVLRKLALFQNQEQEERLAMLFRDGEGWSPSCRLLAIQLLAHSTVSGLFEEAIVYFKQAAHHDDQPLLYLAAETLGLLGDGRAISHFLAVLNGDYAQTTALERYRKAFAAESQSGFPFLVKTLDKLGQKVYQDSFTGRWQVQSQLN